MEPNTLDTPLAPVGAVWPPPSTAQSPVYEFRLNKAMIRSRALWIRIYQPNFWGRKLEINEHGLSGFRSKSHASHLPWSDIEAITLARKRNQINIVYSYHTFGFKAELAQIFSVDDEGFDLLGMAIKRFAKCVVVEDEKIYWSYSKVLIGYSVFWLCELCLLLSNHHGPWASLWGHVVGLLNRLVSFNLP